MLQALKTCNGLVYRLSTCFPELACFSTSFFCSGVMPWKVATSKAGFFPAAAFLRLPPSFAAWPSAAGRCGSLLARLVEAKAGPLFQCKPIP